MTFSRCLSPWLWLIWSPWACRTVQAALGSLLSAVPGHQVVSSARCLAPGGSSEWCCYRWSRRRWTTTSRCSGHVRPSGDRGARVTTCPSWCDDRQRWKRMIHFLNVPPNVFMRRCQRTMWPFDSGRQEKCESFNLINSLFIIYYKSHFQIFGQIDSGSNRKRWQFGKKPKKQNRICGGTFGGKKSIILQSIKCKHE